MFWEEEAINIWWKWLKVFFCAVIGERDIEREEGEQCDYSERVNQSFKLNWWWEGYKTRRSNEIVRKSNEIVNTIREWIKALSRDQEVLNTTCDTFKQIQSWYYNRTRDTYKQIHVATSKNLWHNKTKLKIKHIRDFWVQSSLVPSTGAHSFEPAKYEKRTWDKAWEEQRT